MWSFGHVGPTLSDCCQQLWNICGIYSLQPTWLVFSPPKATHSEAVMCGSLFIYFQFVYPSKSSCCIGRQQQTSQYISHRPVNRYLAAPAQRKTYHIVYVSLSLFSFSPSPSLSLSIYIWCSCWIKVSCFSHLYSRYVGKWAGETQPWVIAFGTVREYAHKHIQASLCGFSNHNHQEQHRRSWWGKHRGYFDIFWAFWSRVINIKEDFSPLANSERRDAGLAQTLWP